MKTQNYRCQVKLIFNSLKAKKLEKNNNNSCWINYNCIMMRTNAASKWQKKWQKQKHAANVSIINRNNEKRE